MDPRSHRRRYQSRTLQCNRTRSSVRALMPNRYSLYLLNNIFILSLSNAYRIRARLVYGRVYGLLTSSSLMYGFPAEGSVSVKAHSHEDDKPYLHPRLHLHLPLSFYLLNLLQVLLRPDILVWRYRRIFTVSGHDRPRVCMRLYEKCHGPCTVVPSFSFLPHFDSALFTRHAA